MYFLFSCEDTHSLDLTDTHTHIQNRARNDMARRSLCVLIVPGPNCAPQCFNKTK